MILEVIGVVGAVAFLLGFYEVSTGKWDGQSRNYELLNLIGALLLGYYSYQKHAYTNIVLNIVWGGVAIYTLLHVVKRHHVRKKVTLAKKRTVQKRRKT